MKNSSLKITTFLLGFILVACGGASGEIERAGKQDPAVTVEAVSIADVSDTISLQGLVIPHEHTRLAGGQGRVDSIFVEDGDPVRKGQVLARIAAGVAEAQYQQADISLKLAKKNLERATSLFDRKMSSQAALEQSQMSVAQAQAGFAMAASKLREAVLRAPHSGIVASKNISVGESSVMGVPAFEIVDLSKVKIIARVAERDVALLKVGSAAQVTLDVMPGENFAGQVSRLGVIADTNSRTFDVELTIPNTDGRLRSGMSARVSLTRQLLPGIPSIRRDTVSEGLSDRAVFVVAEGDVLKRVPVTLGPTSADRVAVLKGLNQGDLVVTSGTRFLVNGQKVRIVPSDAPIPPQDADEKAAVAETSK